MEVLELEQVIKVGVIYNAFDPTDIQKDELVYQEGKSLAHYLDGLPTNCDWMVGLNGVPVKWEEITTTIPAAGDAISLVVIPRGGSAKDILRIVALVAIVVGATLLLGPGSAFFIAYGAAASAAAIATAVLVGGFLVNTLLPPKMPKMDTETDGTNYGYDGAKNTAKEGVPLPVVYGEYRVAGNYVDVFTENAGDQQYLYGRCILSDGEIDSVSEIEVNEQPIDTYKDLLYGTTLGTKTETVNQYFGRSISQISKGLKLSTATTSHTTTTAVDALQLNVYLPRGLVEYDDKGKKKTRQVTLQISYTLAGGGTTTTTMSFRNNTTKTIRSTWNSPNLPRGIYTVTVQRTTSEANDEKVADEIWLGDVGEIQSSNVAVRTVATGWYRVLMTDQLNQIPNITWKVKGVKVNHYNSSGVVTSKAWSANPAWIVLDMLISEERGAFHTNGISIDYQAFIDWAAYCSTNGLMFNGVFDTTKSLWDALTDVFKVGRATPTRIGTKLSLAIDRPSTPVMLFGSGNIEKDTFEISYLPLSDRANEFEVSYYDKNDRNKQKTIRIIDPDAEIRGDIPRSVAYSLMGIDNFEQAQKEVWYQLYMNRLAKRIVTFSAPIESIGLTIGDVALIQHDMVDWGISGRIKNAISTTQLQLDRPITFGDGNTILVTHDSLNGNTDVIEERTVTAIDTSTNTVTVSPAFSAIPNTLSNYMFGESTVVKKPFRLRAISGDDLYSRQLTFVEYHEAIYGPPEQVIPEPTVKLDNVVDQVINLGFITAQEYGPDVEEAVVSVGWTSGHIRNYGGADIYVSRINKDEVDQTPVYTFERTVLNTNEIQISAQYDVNVDIKVVAFNVKGFRANYNAAPVLSATVDATIVVKNPTIASDGTAIDHTVDSATGVAKISFEWTWPGLVADVDGFHVTVLSSSTTDFTGAHKEIFVTGPSQTAIVLGGVDTSKYYKISVKAYRRVHDMLDVTGFIFSTEVFPTGTGENPYRPVDNTAYIGDILGSITEPNPHLDVLGKINTDPNATRNVFRGVWAAGVIYVVGDMFSFNGSTYIVTTAHTSSGTEPDMTKVSVMAEGNSAVTVFLTNEAHTVPTASDGTGGDFTGAVGLIKVFIDAIDVTSTVVFGTPTATNCTGQVNNTTNQFFTGVKGAYRVTAMTADTASLSIPISIDGITINRVFTLAKSKGGANAKTLIISSDRQTIAFDKDDAAVANQTTTFTAQKQNTTATVNWKISTVDAPTTFLTPVTNYLSASTGDSITMTVAQFNSARGTSQGVIVTGELADGTVIFDKISVYKIKAGSDGLGGLNNATVYIYRRSATTPTLPSASTTYTFSNGILTGLNNSWTQGVPAADGNPLWVSVASASANTTTDTIASNEWASPVIDSGAGLNAATVFLYQRTTTNSAPTAPSVTTTYTFSTGVLSGINNGWTQYVPAASNGGYLWITTASALGAGATDTIASGEWATVNSMAQNGVDGVSAKSLLIYSDRQTLTYQNSVASPSSQSIVFTAQKQNTTASVTWYVYDLSGVQKDAYTHFSGMSDDGPGMGMVGDTGTMSVASFDFLRGATNGIIVTATLTDGTTLVDRISIVKVDSGTAGYSGYLTNEAHLVPASSAGVVANYNGATGQFKVSQGGTDISSSFSLSTVTNPEALTIGFSGNTYTISGGLDASEETSVVVFRATGSGAYAGVTIDKAFTLGKSKAGTDGSSAKLIYLTSDRQTITYDGSGAVSPSSQTINFTITRQNTTGNTTISLQRSDGTVLNAASYITASGGGAAVSGNDIVGGDAMTFLITAANFNSAISTGAGIIVTVTCNGVSDKISIVKVANGTAGTSAKLITLTASTNTVAADSSGTAKTPTAKVVYNATLQGLTGSPTWRILSPSGTQIYSGGPLNGGAWSSTGPLHMEETHSGFAADMASNSISSWTVEVSIVDNGTTYTDKVSVALVKDGSSGSGGGGASIDLSATNVASDEILIPVTSGTLYFVGTLSGDNDASSGTHFLELYNSSGTLVQTIHSFSTASNGSGSQAFSSNYATGISGGVYQNWTIKCRAAKGGASGGSTSTAIGTWRLG